MRTTYFKLSFAFNVISAIESTITTHSILGALISDNVQLYNVSINFMAKDVVSNLGSLYVINKMSRHVDVRPMRSMYIAQCAYQFSMLVECLAGNLPSHMFIPAVGISGIGKTVAWTATGAIHAKAVANMGQDEIGRNYSILSSINTFGNSVGTGIGLLIVYHPSHLVVIPFLTVARVLLLRRMVQS